MNKRVIGDEKESAVCTYLEKKGYVILFRNYRVRQGEIDIVAKDGEYLVFIEVKYRSNLGSGTALEAVDYRKCRQISKIALFFLNEQHISNEQAIRFDVVAVDNQQITLVKNAFDYCY